MSIAATRPKSRSTGRSNPRPEIPGRAPTHSARNPRTNEAPDSMIPGPARRLAASAAAAPGSMPSAIASRYRSSQRMANSVPKATTRAPRTAVIGVKGTRKANSTAVDQPATSSVGAQAMNARRRRR